MALTGNDRYHSQRQHPYHHPKSYQIELELALVLVIVIKICNKLHYIKNDVL